MTEYRRYQGKSYMVCSGAADMKGYEYPMLAKNRIPGLLPFGTAHADEKLQFWYDISGRQALEDWMGIKKADSVFLKKFMSALAEAVVWAGEFLLGEDGISLLPERIFVDAKEGEIAFCYMPFEKTSFPDSLKSFMEYYLSHMEHGNREGTQKCYDVYEKCQQAHVSLEDLLAILYEDTAEQKPVYERQEEKAEPIKPKKEAESIKPKSKVGCQNRFVKIWRQIKWFPEKKKKKKKWMQGAYAPYEPKEYPKAAASPTVFLGSETDELLGELRYEGEGSGKNLPITADVFLIGSRQGEVDGMIYDETISRLHAKITREDGVFYLEDMNSTNGTYRNGELLNYKERVRLEKNDRIAFAKVGYRFV